MSNVSALLDTLPVARDTLNVAVGFVPFVRSTDGQMVAWHLVAAVLLMFFVRRAK